MVVERLGVSLQTELWSSLSFPANGREWFRATWCMMNDTFTSVIIYSAFVSPTAQVFGLPSQL